MRAVFSFAPSLYRRFMPFILDLGTGYTSAIVTCCWGGRCSSNTSCFGRAQPGFGPTWPHGQARQGHCKARAQALGQVEEARRHSQEVQNGPCSCCIPSPEEKERTFLRRVSRGVSTLQLPLSRMAKNSVLTIGSFATQAECDGSLIQDSSTGHNGEEWLRCRRRGVV